MRHQCTHTLSPHGRTRLPRRPFRSCCGTRCRYGFANVSGLVDVRPMSPIISKRKFGAVVRCSTHISAVCRPVPCVCQRDCHNPAHGKRARYSAEIQGLQIYVLSQIVPMAMVVKFKVRLDNPRHHVCKLKIQTMPTVPWCRLKPGLSTQTKPQLGL